MRNPDDREKLAREAVRRVLRNLPWLFSEEGNRQFIRRHLEAANIEVLITAAREADADAIDILRKYAGGARRTGMNVPADFHAFVWEWFIDGPPKGTAKTKAGTASKGNELRYQTIAVLVKIVNRDYGFPVYRNPEHRDGEDGDGPMCALQLVAEETRLGYSTVEGHWRDRKASVTRTP